MLGTPRAAYQLRQRVIIEPVEHVAKLLGVGNPTGEILPIGLAQRSDQVLPCLRAMVPSLSR